MKFQEYDDEWLNVPKMHLVQHLFSDIEGKGVTRNYTSKTFETMHSSMSTTYERATNFKNVGSQVSNNYSIISSVMTNL